jgi:hypothetical protein
MIKKSTLIVLVCAALLGGVFYYLDWKSQKAEKSPTATDKPAFTVQTSDISALIVTRPVKPDDPAIRLEKSGGNWKIAQPMETAADGSVVDQSLDTITSARISQTEPYAPDRLKAFGLDPPKISAELQLKNGTKHTLLMGDKVFDGSSVYAVIDGAKTVSVLPDSVLTSTDKSVDDWRDHGVLHITGNQVPSFTLKNPSGEIALAKTKEQWNFSKPSEARADKDSIDSLLTAIQNAKFTTVASEKAENLGKYGLTSPAVSITATDDTGKKFTLEIGKKDGNDYFARDTSRPVIFHVNSDLYTQLTKGFADLRDKKVLQFDAADINRVEIHNGHGTIVLNAKDDVWTFESPADQKGKLAASGKIFDQLSGLRADQVIDHPDAAVGSKLVKPAIEIILTDKNKKATTLKISQPAGDVVYAEVSDNPSGYKLRQQDFDNLNIDPNSLRVE